MSGINKTIMTIMNLENEDADKQKKHQDDNQIILKYTVNKNMALQDYICTDVSRRRKMQQGLFYKFDTVQWINAYRVSFFCRKCRNNIFCFFLFDHFAPGLSFRPELRMLSKLENRMKNCNSNYNVTK